MKLIIDIPKDAYDYVMGSGYFPSNFNMIYEIRNGIPLDKIRTEIAEEFIKHGLGNTEICFDTLKIIDKYREGGD